MDLLNSPFKTSPEEEARLKEQAKNFPVTKLPYAGPLRTRTPRFDLFSHARKRLRASSAKTGLSFSDLQQMHIDHRSENDAQWVPDFANNDHDLQSVLAESAKAYAKMSGSGVEVTDCENLDELKAIVAEAFKRVAARHIGEAPKRRLERTENGMIETIVPCDSQFANHRVHVITVEKAGGYLERDAAVAYQTWRLRRNSTLVGSELGLMPSHVRRILGGLCATARTLGFDATAPRGDHTRGKLRDYRPNVATAKLPMSEELVALVLSGKTFEQVAEQYGVKSPKSVLGAYVRGKKLVMARLRRQNHTWDEINEHFKNEPTLSKRQSLTPDASNTVCAATSGGY
jgi:hypothetical protein